MFTDMSQNNDLSLTSGEFLALLLDLQRSPAPNFQNNFFHDEDVTLSQLMNDCKYTYCFKIYRYNLFISVMKARHLQFGMFLISVPMNAPSQTDVAVQGEQEANIPDGVVGEYSFYNTL
jgi:hypothetical protein